MTTIHLPPTVETKRDRYGRYLLPDPETGKERPWTRITTVANTLADRYGLEQWAQRNTALGIGLRPDLYALAVSSPADDRSQLNRIVKQAQEAAKASSGANLGTALHKITERVDRGDDLDIPAEWRGDVDAYCQTLADHHIAIDPEWIERIVINPTFGVAGTLDRLVGLSGQATHTVADLKTGKDVVKYGIGEIAIQLALYATATHAWDGENYQPLPPVDTSKGLIIHLPVGKAQCTLHTVDIAAGLEAARIAIDVRQWRKRKDLTSPYSILDQAVGQMPAGNQGGPLPGENTWKEEPRPVADDDW